MLSTVLAASPVDPKSLLETFGVLGLFGIVFAETGLMVGFFLPGDSLLVLAGLVAAVGSESKLNVDVNLWVLLVGLFIAAVIGAQTGYFIGLKAGPALFRRPDSRLFKREYVDKAEHYFNRYGPKTIVIARFIPIVRTFANPIAGVAQMPVRSFTIFNIVGAALWTVGVTMIGFVLGKTIPGAEDHLLVIEAIIIGLSLVPIAVEVVRSRRERAKTDVTA
ncbi:MAG TPA: VTT domain-containing protein [Acidimicrobiales bacterium]|jgi:membrane-associated protein|nr:VTT domain-containing protein [Acidimicrobiales bacterium]